MRGFTVVSALLAGFLFLLFQFSFWAAFGGMYLAGMMVIAIVAYFGGRQPAHITWDESTEADPV